jgi:flavin-binding protein dodecin
VTILKSDQILADSSVSWQDAVETAIKRFAKTVRNVRSAYVNEFTTVVENGRVESWRVNLQVTFEVDEPAASGARQTRTRARAAAAPAKSGEEVRARPAGRAQSRKTK